MVKDLLIGLGCAVVGWTAGVEVYRRSDKYRKHHQRAAKYVKDVSAAATREIAAAQRAIEMKRSHKRK